MAVLIGLSDEVSGRQFPLETEKTMIGRDPGNHIMVDNGTVSGDHCFILREDDAYSIQDLGSTNGITVNSELVNHRKLHADDIIEVGSVAFRLQLEAHERPPPAPLQPAEPAAAPSRTPSFSARPREDAPDSEPGLAEPVPAEPIPAEPIPAEPGPPEPIPAEPDPPGEALPEMPASSPGLQALWLTLTLLGLLALAAAVIHYIGLIMG